MPVPGYAAAMTLQEDRSRYERAMHGVQSGVAAKMAYDDKDTSPKHLRTGVNSAMVQHSGLVLLLMRKGVIGEGEYWAAMADAAEQERALYERWLSERTGASVHLG
jgi:hypothetical protein